MNGLRMASEWLVSAGVCQIPFTLNGAMLGELELLVPALAWGAKVFCETRCQGTAVFMSGSSQATALAGLSSEQRQVGGLVVITML